MSGAPSGKKQQSQAELQTARTLNTVAIIGASHPMYTASRKLARDTGVSDRVGRLVPVKVKEAASSVAARGRNAMASNPVTAAGANFARKHGKAAAVGAGVGWLGFHGAELAGDFMGRRSINRQLDQVKAKQKEPAVKSDVLMTDIYKSAGRGTGQGVNLLSKRYYDPEADRQRRLGLGAGLGGGTAIVLGDAARRQIVAEKVTEGGRKGIKLHPKGKLRTPILLGSGAALSAVAAGAAYKHGLSDRNRPWT